MRRLVTFLPPGLELITWWSGHVEPEAENTRGLQPGVAHAVGVADPSNSFASNRPAVLDIGKDVGDDLTRMILVGQSIDHRNARMRREALYDALLEGADHDDIDHPRQHFGDVLDRLAAAELRGARAQEDCGAAELRHTRFERYPRARRALLEDHAQGLAPQRLIELAIAMIALQQAGPLEQIGELRPGKVGEFEKMSECRHISGRCFFKRG